MNEITRRRGIAVSQPTLGFEQAGQSKAADTETNAIEELTSIGESMVFNGRFHCLRFAAVSKVISVAGSDR